MGVKLLLDTHIWLWSVLEPVRLARRVRAALDAPDNELWLSPISTWELMLLAARGRLRLDTEVETWIGWALSQAAFREAPLTHEVAIRTRQIRLRHRDPADALLAATAAVYDLTLVTADHRLLGSKSYAVLANR